MDTFSARAREAWLLAAGLLLVVSLVACGLQSRPASKTSGQDAANRPADAVIEVSPADTTAASDDDPCSQMFSNLFVGVDSISYNGFEVVRLHKTVYDKPSKMNIPVSYAELRSGGRTIATFEGVYSDAGNGTDFGFASLLGGETKQLIVSQTVPRGGRHWIVDISSDGATLFDSYDWDLGREEVCVHDFDGDGISEISMLLASFWGFGAMSMAESPMPDVVFKYEANVRKYLPDKQQFARGVTHIDEDVQTIDPDEDPREGLKGPYLATRLDIFLRYVYAGRESDAWSFFDRTYNLADKQEMKREIKRILDAEPVYRFVYGMKPVNRHLS